MNKTVLILGARGRFGLAAVQAFASAGWHVKALVRPGSAARLSADTNSGIEWISADLQDSAAIQQISRATRGTSVVVHALNPLYTDRAWQTQAMPLTQAAIRLAQSLNATLMFMGNVYNFGADMPAVLTEKTPQRPSTIKGQIRVALEEEIRNSGVRAVVIRAGDFFGGGTGTWFDQVVVKDIRKGRITYPGHDHVATPWAYLPDLAQTFVEVAAQLDSLSAYEEFNFAGHALTGRQWIDALQPIARSEGWIGPDAPLKSKPFPWLFIKMGALFNPVWASLVKMRYLWDTPYTLDNTKLVKLLGAEPRTTLPTAVFNALSPVLHG